MLGEGRGRWAVVQTLVLIPHLYTGSQNTKEQSRTILTRQLGSMSLILNLGQDVLLFFVPSAPFKVVQCVVVVFYRKRSLGILN